MAYNKYGSSSAGSLLFFLFAAVVVVGGLVWQFGGAGANKAEKVAMDKGGLTEVTSVKRDVFNLCDKNSPGYKVKGVRDEKPVTITVCVSSLPWGSYIR